MRHNEYILEKNRYTEPKFIQKHDKKYKKSYPNAFRFHIFVKVNIVSINKNIATVIYEKQEQYIILQNMDSYFYLNEVRKQKITEMTR